MSYTIDEVNQMSRSTFVDAFGSVFEETPTIATNAWDARPFADLADMHQKMVAVVKEQMTHAEKLALICAHPELGAKQKMAAASVQEQKGAGLSQLAQEEQQQIDRLNARYQEKFDFPFVMAVKGFSREEILAAFETRLNKGIEEEMNRSLQEIYKIAQFRLDDLIADLSSDPLTEH